ncbi:hypothetical protein DICVIV_10614 [Dictyocaulus viviparus]|uniref:Uncharacterized protein n=1 Tax=Dictyocaulus viviparus TaxID=29172 RepID=A0A0D8XI08_DICVI|nr:hypothetical protein DICVIV_10614 [Dictyocaulus viviparus]
MSKSFLVITALILTCDTKLEQKKLYSWMENQVLLSVSPKNSTLSLTSSDDIPEVPQPFILNTALKTPQYRINSTEDEVITDEDVAGDDDESTKVNTAHYDGKKTTITISTEAGIELYQHWLDQAVSGLMAAIATEKLARVSDIQKAAHNTCTKSATTVQAHAKCVVVLLDIEQKYQRWTAKFGNAKRINMKQSWMTKGKSLKRFEKQHWRKSPRPHSVERKPFPTMQGRSKWSMKRNGNEVANRSAGKVSITGILEELVV